MTAVDSEKGDAPRRVEEVLLDPRWEVAGVRFEGFTFVTLSILHPRHGWIDALLPIAEGTSLGSLLLRASNDIGDGRLKEGGG